MTQSYASGVVYPLAWLNVLEKTDTLAELKVVACVWGYDGIIGIDTEALTFGELLRRTGLSKRSLQEGIRRALESKLISSNNTESSPQYFPVTKSSLHDHDIMINKDIMLTTESIREEHDHVGYFVTREDLRELLGLEFDMNRSPRVADDICFSPKYSMAYLATQLRYARWENKRGKDSKPSRPVKNPAGNLVNRLRTNERAPEGFSLVQALLEDEGWTRDKLYWSIYNGEVDMPAVKDTFEYSSWLYELMEAEQEGVLDES